jgi:hypothetical protein
MAGQDLFTNAPIVPNKGKCVNKYNRICCGLFQTVKLCVCSMICNMIALAGFFSDDLSASDCRLGPWSAKDGLRNLINMFITKNLLQFPLLQVFAGGGKGGHVAGLFPGHL